VLLAVADCRQIWQNFVNMRRDFIVENDTVKALQFFYDKQDAWTRSMIKNHPPKEDSYWRHVAYVMAQFDGLYAGYRDTALPEWVRGLYSYPLCHSR